MKFRFIALLVALAVAAPTFAHHSTAMYDMQNPVTVTGVVKRFEWTNPHAFVFLEVKDQKGNVVEWEVEMMSLNHLRGYGWTRSTVKPGEMISCTGGTPLSPPMRDRSSRTLSSSGPMPSRGESAP